MQTQLYVELLNTCLLFKQKGNDEVLLRGGGGGGEAYECKAPFTCTHTHLPAPIGGSNTDAAVGQGQGRHRKPRVWGGG